MTFSHYENPTHIIPSESTVSQLNDMYGDLWHSLYTECSRKTSDTSIGIISEQLLRMVALRIPTPSDFHYIKEKHYEFTLMMWDFTDSSFVLHSQIQDDGKKIYMYYRTTVEYMKYLKGISDPSRRRIEILESSIIKNRVVTHVLDAVLSIVKTELRTLNVFVTDDETIPN